MACVLKFPVELLIQVPDVNTQITAGFEVIQIHRSTNGKSGLFEEITDADTRPVLVSNQVEYQFIDADGSPSFWYRYRLANAAGSLLGSFSSPFAGGNDPALDVLSVAELKELYLFGIDLSDDAGKPFPDTIFEHYIRSAVSWLEHRLDLSIRTVDMVEERQDYYREDYDKYIWVELDRFPVIEVTEVKLVLPGEAVVQVFNREWIHVQRELGQVQLVPGTGTAGTILLGASGAWIPLIYGNNRYIPDVFRTTYRAGFGAPSVGAFDTTPGLTGPVSVPHPELDRGLPEVLKDTIGKFSSFGPLNIAGDLIVGAGIASKSLSIDGLSQSISTTSSATNAGYGARLVQYQKELKVVVPELQRYYKGLRMRVA